MVGLPPSTQTDQPELTLFLSTSTEIGDIQFITSNLPPKFAAFHNNIQTTYYDVDFCTVINISLLFYLHACSYYSSLSSINQLIPWKIPKLMHHYFIVCVTKHHMKKMLSVYHWRCSITFQCKLDFFTRYSSILKLMRL